MAYKLQDIQKILSEQNYLEFDKILTSIQEQIDFGKKVEIIDKDGNVAVIITSFEELEFFKKRMIQIYGIYGYF
jgi:hypothetical protein